MFLIRQTDLTPQTIDFLFDFFTADPHSDFKILEQ